MKRMRTVLVFAVTALFASTVPVAAFALCDYDVSGSVFGGDNPVTVELCPTCTAGPTLRQGDSITVKILNTATCSGGEVGSAEAGYVVQTVIVGENNEGLEFSAVLQIAPGSSGQVQFTMPLGCDSDLDGVCANRVIVGGLFTSVPQKVPAMAVDITVTPAPVSP